MKKNYIILIILIFYITALSAQKGTISGKVIDGNTGEEIIGAQLVVEGAGKFVGTVTDYEGNFLIQDLPEKELVLKCSSPEYQTKIIDKISIMPGVVKVIDIAMGQIMEDLKEVIVSATVITNTASAMQTIQNKSGALINGISSQQISLMGDSDAASVVKRVSGVSITDGKYVFVRGLSDRYSKVTLNRSEIPGLDPNTNTVQMDIFPSNIIDNIIVHKTSTPNLPSSFTGGYVDISTKSYPEKFTLQFSTSLGYNPQANLRKDFLTHSGGKYDFFGIDDGTRNIPSQASSEVPFLYQDNEKLDQISKSFNKTMGNTEKTSFLDHSHSFSIGNRVKLFNRPLGFIVSTSYSRKFEYFDDGISAKYYLVNTQGEEGTMNLQIQQNERNSEEEVLLSALVGASYKLTNNHSFGFTLLKNHSGLINSKNREGYKNTDNIYIYENVLGFQERDLNYFQLTGNHVFKDFANLEIEWVSSLAKSGQSEPDLRFFIYDQAGEKYQISPNAYPSPVRFFREMSEINTDEKIDLSLPLNIFSKKSVFKFGTALTYKERNSDSRKFDILSQNVDFDGNIENYLSDENIGENAGENGAYGIYYQNDPLTDAYNSYFATEVVYAGYAMIDIPLSEKLRLITGARYEYDKSFIKNNIESYHHKYVEAEHAYPSDILPSINLRYSLSNDMNLRTAYAKTVGRPAFREIAPYAYYDFKEAWRVVGNPDLERTLVDNLDLRWEYFMPQGQMVSASLFYKYFQNPIELVDDARASNPEFHYVNIDKSNMFGLELELRKNLAQIGLDNFSLGGNLTILKSEVEYVENYGATEQRSVTGRPMYGQAPWVINSFISYENKGMKLKSNLGFNVSGKTLAVVTKGDTPNIYNQPSPNMNFNISKGLGNKFEIKLSAGNILDSVKKKTYTYQGKEYIYRSHTLGRTYSFSLSYKI